MVRGWEVRHAACGVRYAGCGVRSAECGRCAVRSHVNRARVSVSHISHLASRTPHPALRIHTATGAATFVQNLEASVSFSGLAWLNNGLYGSDLIGYPGGSGGFDVGSIDPESGAREILADRLSLEPSPSPVGSRLATVPGLAVGSDGTIFVSVLAKSAVYRLHVRSTD